jgi:hypothetical protein
MIKNIRLIIIIVIVLILFVISGTLIVYFKETDKTSIGLDVFKNMASNATCSDITNKLFVIDNQMVFWITEGICPDASYVYTLFGITPDEVLCKRFDSIAGPQEQCNDEDFREIFQIIVDNLDADDLGLDVNHIVTEVLF